MSFNPSIPSAEDLISVSQSDIQTNFSQINSVFGVDHVTLFPSVANSGKHKQVTLPELESAPSTAVNEGAVYTAQGTVSAVTELYFRKENNGTSIPLTGDATLSPEGQTTLPGGVIMKWGTATVVGSNEAATITFPTAFSTSVYNVMLQVTTILRPENPEYFVSSVTTSSFVINSQTTSGSKIFYWIAMGV